MLKKAQECHHKVYFYPELAEEIDEIFTAGMIASEKQCRVSYRLPWDKETDAVMTAYNIVQMHLSCLLCNYTLPKTLDAKMRKLDEPFDLPTILEDTCILRNKLYNQQRDLILSCCSNQATNYKEQKEAFVALYKRTFGSEKKAE